MGLISVRIPNISPTSLQLHAPKLRQVSKGVTTSVMISEVLFGYFLFKEKVTDASELHQVASLSYV